MEFYFHDKNLQEARIKRKVLVIIKHESGLGCHKLLMLMEIVFRPAANS